MLTYEPELIDHYANKLYAKAASTETFGTLVGFLLGGIGVYIVAHSVGQWGPVEWGIAAAGALVGAFIGLAISQGRGFEMRLQAQRGLCLRTIEANTRRLLEKADEEKDLQFLLKLEAAAIQTTSRRRSAPSSQLQ